MASLIRVSEAASIALHACLWMARAPAEYCRSKDICATLGFSAAHFAKVMQALSRAGLVSSARGPTGGTRLARPPNQITLLQVYEAVGGPTQTARCLLAPDNCPAAGCKLGQAFARHNAELRQLFAATTLPALARNFKVRPATPASGCAAARPRGRKKA